MVISISHLRGTESPLFVSHIIERLVVVVWVCALVSVYIQVLHRLPEQPFASRVNCAHVWDSHAHRHYMLLMLSIIIFTHLCIRLLIFLTFTICMRIFLCVQTILSNGTILSMMAVSALPAWALWFLMRLFLKIWPMRVHGMLLTHILIFHVHRALVALRTECIHLPFVFCVMMPQHLCIFVVILARLCLTFIFLRNEFDFHLNCNLVFAFAHTRAYLSLIGIICILTFMWAVLFERVLFSRAFVCICGV